MSALGLDEEPAAAPTTPARGRLAGLQDSETAKAAGLAAATMAANVVAIVFTMVFTRVLGAGGYGSLAALISLSIILFVPGAALQVAAARQGALGRLGEGGELAATLRRWTRHLLLTLVAVTVVCVLAREPVAALLNVDESWAAAAVGPTGALWLLLCVQRGLLMARSSYRAVGLSIVLEAVGRLVAALVLTGVGLGVTGAYLGTLASIAVTAVVLDRLLHRRLGAPAIGAPPHPLRRLAAAGALPIVVLVLVAVLQNIDVIVAKHVLEADTAGVYAAATVAAKAIVWVAIGIGLWVLPEATRRAAAGADARTVLLRALALVGVLAAAALAIFTTAPELVLRLGFGPEYESGADILPVLGVAYALLAAGYLMVQFLLGLHHRAFVAALALAAVVQPLVLLGADSSIAFARTVLAVQIATTLALAAFSLARRQTMRPG